MGRQNGIKIYFTTGLLCIAIMLTVACRQGKTYNKNSTHQGVSDESIRTGEVLANQYCQSCHLLPSPSLLSAATWENGVLPNMGPRLGIFEYKYKKYPSSVNDVHVGRSFYPPQPMVTPQQWQSIFDFYTSLAPDTLSPRSKDAAVFDVATFFQPIAPTVKYYSPATGFIQEDTATHSFMLADILKRTCYRYNNKLQLVDSFLRNNIVTDMQFAQDSVVACNIGVFTPLNVPTGSLVGYNTRHKNSLGRNANTIVDTLLRPVSFVPADINNDGKQDYVICNFGYVKGALVWAENKGNGQYETHTIKPVPGAIKAYITDDNHDGLPDIWTLFAQGDEGISLFINKGNGNFEEKRVLRFPPSYGSSYFEFDDFNKDGHPDILYTCGDNADFSPELKPYHGVYIFMNDGHDNFKQSYFYHIDGCYKAMARDFAGNGKLDIAAIAYFADFGRDAGFVYLKNNGSLNYIPYTVPGCDKGRWITMDVNDVDGDGKLDILLGNCSIGPTINKSINDWKNGPPFLLLKNMY